MTRLRIRPGLDARAVVLAGAAMLVLTAAAAQAQVFVREERAPDPVTFSGRGNETTREFPLVRGLTVVSFEHEGKGDFSVVLRRADGGTGYGTVYADIGEVDGSTAFHLFTSEDYELVVRARRDWTVTVSQPREEGGDYTEFWGTGPQASPLLDLHRGSHAFHLVHEGDGVFKAKLLDRHGFFVQWLIRARGSYDGVTAIKLEDGGDYLIVVETEPDAEWSIVRQY